MKCPIQKHTHDLIPMTGLSWQFECPGGAYRWVRASDGLLEGLNTAPAVIVEAIKKHSITVDGVLYTRQTRPHWGWIRGR